MAARCLPQLPISDALLEPDSILQQLPHSQCKTLQTAAMTSLAACSRLLARARISVAACSILARSSGVTPMLTPRAALERLRLGTKTPSPLPPLQQIPQLARIAELLGLTARCEDLLIERSARAWLGRTLVQVIRSTASVRPHTYTVGNPEAVHSIDVVVNGESVAYPFRCRLCAAFPRVPFTFCRCYVWIM
jgi:hypothetical protein